MCYLFQPENFAAFKSSQMGAANPGSSSASSALSLGCYSFISSTPWVLVSCHCHPALEGRGRMVLHSSNSQLSSVQLLSHVWLFVTSWNAAHQASLSITNSRSLLKLMSIKSGLPSYHLILCHSLSPPTFNVSQHQAILQWVSSSYQVAEVLEFQLQHQSFQWIFRTDFL